MTQWGLDTLFNPAKRHMDEEKRRLQATREEVGDSSGGRRIDLESGKVTIKRSTARNQGEEAAAAGDAAVESDEAAEAAVTDDEPAVEAETTTETTAAKPTASIEPIEPGESTES